MELAKKYGVDGTNTMSNNAANEGLNEGLNLSDKENKIIELIKKKDNFLQKKLLKRHVFHTLPLKRL